MVLGLRRRQPAGACLSSVQMTRCGEEPAARSIGQLGGLNAQSVNLTAFTLILSSPALSQDEGAESGSEEQQASDPIHPPETDIFDAVSDAYDRQERLEP